MKDGVDRALREGEAHIWTVPLDRVRALSAAGDACLSPAERAHIERIGDPVVRRHYAVTRAALRTLLGACTGIAAGRLELRRSAQGKPFMAARAGVDFSISHSRGVALLGIASVAIGVDIEHVRRPLHLDRTARRILHPDTVALLEARSGDDRVHAFIDAWTLRESHVKAVGGGLFRTPDALPFDASRPADGVLRTVAGRDGETWSVARFAPGPGMRAAVVLHGAGRVLHLHDAAETLTRLEEVFDGVE